MDHVAHIFSSRVQELTSSAIREVLRITERPEVIPLAGGLPAPATLPVEAIQVMCARTFADSPQTSLQYTPTEGLSVLHEWVAQRHDITASYVLITTGLQQGLDLFGKISIGPQGKVLVGALTYLDALQAFSLFKPTYTSIATNDQDLLSDTLTPELAAGTYFFYTIPSFQNPTDHCLPLDRCQALVAHAKELGVLLVEDGPHGELSYTGNAPPSLHSFNPDGVVYIGSFSKILAPGMRLGYITTPEHTHFKPVRAKQASDLHTPSFMQRVAYEVLKAGLLDTYIPSIQSPCGKQCEAMLDLLTRHIPAGVRWDRPKGDMFIWVGVPKDINTMILLEGAVARNTALVPGTPFYANAPYRNTLHLAFVTVTLERIEQGITVLGELMRAEIATLTPKTA